MTNTADIYSSTIMLHELHDSWSSLVVGDDVETLASMKQAKKSVHGIMFTCSHMGNSKPVFIRAQ